MADYSKRSLRERRAPKNFGSDNEDLDPWGYAKPSYSRPCSQQELRNPSQQLNSDAKLLVQFLTTINKRLKEYVAAHAIPQPSDIKEPPLQQNRKNRTVETGNEPQKRQTEGKQTKIDLSKRGKDSQSLKAQISGAAVSYNKNESLLSQYKALNAESASKMLSIENSLKSKQPSLDSNQARLQKMKPANQQEPSSTIKKSQMPSKNGQKLSLQTQPQGSFSNISKQNLKRSDDSKPAKALSDNKIFKRSAYHVAIAYHIYIRKMREKGALGSEIDPTYNARRLREGLGK